MKKTKKVAWGVDTGIFGIIPHMIRILFALSFGLLLAACGGGGGALSVDNSEISPGADDRATPPLVCGENEINNGAACVCDSGYEEVGGKCVPVLLACPANSARPSSRAVCECNGGYEEVGGKCVPVLSACPANSARPSSRAACECDNGYEEVGAECLAVLSACPANSARPSSRAECECNGGYEKVGAECVIEAEYLANPYLDYINPRYAYEQGYYGEGVTIAISEGLVSNNCFQKTHEDLGENQLTMDINSDPDNERFGCIEREGTRRHGTNVSRVAAAIRDGKGTHGVAPHAKLLPLRVFHADAMYDATELQ